MGGIPGMFDIPGDDVIETYEANTDEARRLGVFGSPTFAVDGAR